MSRRVLVPALLLIVSAAGWLTAQTASQTPARAVTPARAATPDVLYRQATEAWTAGDYPVALTHLTTLMKSAAAPDYRDRVALLTGELFTTTEITTDGRNPSISPDGRYVAYEFGPASDPSTRIVSVADGTPEPVVTLRGANVAFDAASRQIAWVRPADGSAWTAAVRAIDDAASAAARNAANADAAWLLASEGQLVVRNLATGVERIVPTAGVLKTAPAFDARDTVIFLGADPTDLTRSDVYRDEGAPTRLTTEPGFKSNVMIDRSGGALLYTIATAPTFRQPAAANAAGGGPGRGGRAGGGGGAPAGPNPCGGGRGGGTAFAVVNLQNRTTRTITGSSPTMSADGKTIAWLQRDGAVCRVEKQPTLGTEATTARTGTRVNAPALSPDGSQVAYEYMTDTDWEIYITGADGESRRITRDIQHDLLPRFLSNTTLLSMMGEARHRRSQIYDLTSDAPWSTRERLFANNTIRTISPEYIWLPSADGRRLVISAERDGDTVSPERGVYLVDLATKVSTADLLARLARQHATETELRSRMTRMFAPISDLIKRVVAKASISRVYEYEKTQFDFDSKYVSQPGNNKAIDYLTRTYASFGYKPEQQWFSPPQAQGGRTANVVNIKTGTDNPELIYVVSSHFDSVVGGPGADDDTSGTAALLETARLLADVPLPATVVFASFTGEEAGLLGSREFVRLAAERKWNVVGALNNDMIGWGGESARMDNTIRYSNAGIRDIQLGASFLFTDLILYDAKYYKGTDANAFYDGWGDIVGGIGSYPVLANPNYHQPTDFIETMNFQQITETAKVTAATLVYLASSPSRLKGLTAERRNGTLNVSWTASPEKGVRSYIVAYGPETDPLRTRVTVTTNRATLPAVPAGSVVSVKAVNARGLEGWDWARLAVRDIR